MGNQDPDARSGRQLGRLLLHPILRDSLPARERRVLLLHLGLVRDVPAQTLDEIAARLDIPVEVARMRLARAWLRVRAG